MKIDMGDMPTEIYDGRVALGDVFPIQGGVGAGRRFRIVVSATKPKNEYDTTQICCLIVDRTGEIVGCDKVADFYLERKGRIGVCDIGALSQMRIDWL